MALTIPAAPSPLRRFCPTAIYLPAHQPQPPSSPLTHATNRILSTSPTSLYCISRLTRATQSWHLLREMLCKGTQARMLSLHQLQGCKGRENSCWGNRWESQGEVKLTQVVREAWKHEGIRMGLMLMWCCCRNWREFEVRAVGRVGRGYEHCNFRIGWVIMMLWTYGWGF